MAATDTSAPAPPGAAAAPGRDAAWGLIGALAGAVANFAVLVLIAVAYGTTLFGVFSAVAALFQLGTATLRMGADVGSVFLIGRTDQKHRASTVRDVLSAALVPVVGISTAVSAVVIVAAPSLAEALSNGDTDTYRSTLRILAIALPVATAGEVLLAATRGLGSMMPTVVASNGGRQVGQLITVGLAAIVSDRPEILAAAWALPYLATVVYPVVWLRPRCARGSGALPWGQLWRYSGPQAASATVQGGLEKVDIIMLHSAEGAGTTALYSMANRFVHLVVLARYTIGIASSAEFARHLADSDGTAAHRLAARVGAWTALVCAPALALFVMLPAALLGIVGAEYTAGATALVVLAAGMAVSIGFGPAPTMLVMGGATGRSFAYSALALSLNIGLNLALIPRHGATGAAIAWAIAIVVPRALALLTVHRRSGVWAATQPLFLALALGAVPFGGAALVTRLLWGDSLLALVITVLVGAPLWGTGIARVGARVFAAELLATVRPGATQGTAT